jgi:pimeloyl-ACP methyl ester carboxylesterase
MPNISGVQYTDQGKGFPIILLHGFCETHEVWTGFAKALATDYRIINIDLPGFGESKLLANNFSIADAAGKVLEVLAKLEIEKCVVIGHSLGGYVTLAMVHRQPERFTGFGLFHSTAYADSAERKESRNKVIEFVSKNGVAAFIETFIPPLFHDKSNPHIPAAVSMALQTAPETLIGYAKAMRDRPDLTSVIKKSLNPILFIAGEKDSVIPYKSLQTLANEAQKPHIHVIQGVAHMGMFENERETLRVTREFIRTTAG